MTDGNKIIDFKKRLEASKEAPDAENEAAVIVCPHCQSVDWAVTVDEETACIDFMICVSDYCDGDSYIEVHDGVVDQNVYKIDLDFDTDY